MRFLLFLIALCTAAPASAKPRAVSLDYCSDQYLLMLGDPEQITALSRGSDKDYSYLRAQSAPYPKVRPNLEEVAPHKPDIVLRQWGGGANAEELFSRFDATVVSLDYPDDFDGVIDNILLAAAVLEQMEKGEALVSHLQERLHKLETRTESHKNMRALYVTPGGVTAAANTMIDAIFKAAGIINISAEAGQNYWPPLPAEALLLAPPELIVSGFFVSKDEQINFWSSARHPALQKLLRDTPTVQLPPDIISCAAWFSVDAAEMIAQETRHP